MVGASWGTGICPCLYNSFTQVFYWTKINDHLRTVITLHEKFYGPQVTTRLQDWPLGFALAFMQLDQALFTVSERFRFILKEAVVASAPLHHLWDMERWAPAVPVLVAKEAVDRSDPLLPLLGRVTREGVEDRVEPHVIIEDIHRLIAGDSKQRARITPCVADALANLGLMEEIKRQMQQHCRTFHGSWYRANKLIYEEHSSPIEPLLCIARNIIGEFARTRNTPTREDLHYPAEKSRNHDCVLQMQKAEHILDQFWSNLNAYVEKRQECLLSDLIPGIDFADRRLERTPDWVPVDLKTPATGDKVFDEHMIFLSNNVEAWSIKTPSSTSKPKLKTRGVPSEENSTLLEDQQLPTSEISNELKARRAFKLKPRDLKVFRTLFYQPTHLNNIELGQVKWLDFLHAMANVGIGFMYQKLEGSNWQFNPSPELALPRGISFHEPHPDSKLTVLHGTSLW